MRYKRHRKDQNHDALSAELEARGWLLFNTQNVDYFVDQIAVKGGRVVFVEYKAGRCAAERKPKPHQEALHDRLRAAGVEVAVVASREDLGQFERL